MTQHEAANTAPKPVAGPSMESSAGNRLESCSMAPHHRLGRTHSLFTSRLGYSTVLPTCRAALIVGGSGEHRPVDINALVEESLNLAYHGARAEKPGFDIALERSFDPVAGEVDLFPQEITRVLLNLISNGFYAASAVATAGNPTYGKV
jgi:signal transduction histidine kinase